MGMNKEQALTEQALKKLARFWQDGAQALCQYRADMGGAAIATTKLDERDFEGRL